VSDLDGDELLVATGIVFQGQSATITPPSRTISGSGTAVFTVTVVQTNADVTLFVSDNRGGSDSEELSVGSDFSIQTCTTG
jgi:hypothetical protein